MLLQIVRARSSDRITYFNSFTKTGLNSIDVIIADEAHRIRESSDSRFTPLTNRSNLLQVEELIRASKTAVFFIDDDQVVRPGEIGTAKYIKENAEDNGCNVLEFQLGFQYRPIGADAFTNWIDNTLEISRTAEPLWHAGGGFDFRILASPEAL